MDRARVIAIVGLAACAVVASSCRQPRRGLRVGSDAATLKVNMVNIDKADQGRTDLIYELSTCLAPINGVVKEGAVVEFKDTGIKKGISGCQVRVRMAQVPSDMEPVQRDIEPGVLYWAKDLSVTQDLAGDLVANAGLQKLYVEVPNAQRSSFKLEVPVKFPKPENDKPLTAAVVCTTPVANVGVYGSQNSDAGTFTFTIPVSQDVENTCNQILVSAGGILHKYKGEFGTNGKFKMTPNGSWKAAEIALSLQVTTQPGPTPGDSQISVETKAAKQNCDKQTQVFDVAQAKCVDR